LRVGASSQGSDGVKQHSAVPNNAGAHVLEVFRCQVRQDLIVDCVLAERRRQRIREVR
jgi:hypothetical protein